MHDRTRQLEVIVGCMFSGKTSELLRRLERVILSGRKILLFKPSIDDRYRKDAVVTHFGREFPAVLLDRGEETMEVLEKLVGKEAIEEATVVAFDEGNFFSDKLINLCQELVAKGKRVIVAGLDLTSNEEPFVPMPTLVCLADSLVKLDAVCVVCGGVATRSQRIAESRERIYVGGKQDYEARCRSCYEKP